MGTVDTLHRCGDEARKKGRVEVGLYRLHGVLVNPVQSVVCQEEWDAQELEQLLRVLEEQPF